MDMSKEKQELLELPDNEIRKVLKYVSMLQAMERKAQLMQTTKGNAYSQLQELIGLTEVKQTIDRMIALRRLQNIAHMRGRIFEKPAMHMEMLGGPGTAKTTVARLFPQILKESGICAKGSFVEAGRADLISDHVGGTAPLVEEICRKAKGGVLFIDEAYSFVDEGNSYCPEFISTLIQEMENNKNDLIVIFAGYPAQMDKFMESNPGLKSRVPFTIHFPDYTPTEMLAIARHMAGKKGFDIAESADTQLLRNFEIAMKAENFGNARYVRNQVEQAIMNKAQSVHYRDCLHMSDDELFSLNANDFPVEKDSEQKNPAARRIGFAV